MKDLLESYECVFLRIWVVSRVIKARPFVGAGFVFLPKFAGLERRGFYLISILSPQIKGDITESSFELSDDGIYSECICRQNLSGQRAEKATFRCMIFKNAVLNGAVLCGADIGDVRFENCDLSNLDLNDSTIFRVEFIRCRLTGTDLSSSHIRNAVFEDCGGKYANFRFARIEKAAFKNCALQGTDFQSAEISKVIFSGDDFRQAQMSGVPLCGIDFSSCNIDGLCARPEDLRGAIITAEQAVTAAQIIGMKIK